MPLGYYTMQWMNQGPPSLILLICGVITCIRHFLVIKVMSLSVKRLVQFGRIISEGFDTNFEVMVNEDDNLDESKPSEIINFQTIFLNDFLIGKRINRMMTVSERPNFYDRAMSYATNAFEILSKLSNIFWVGSKTAKLC